MQRRRDEASQEFPAGCPDSVSHIQICNNGHNDAGGQDTSESRNKCTGHSCDLDSDKGGGIDGDRSGSHLGNGDQICELSH